jgi:hypothetical protein
MARFTAPYTVRYLGEQGEWATGDTIFVPPLPEKEAVRFGSPNESPTFFEPLPLAHQPGFVLGVANDFWITEGGDGYRILQQNFSRDTLAIVERQYTPVPVPDSVRQKAVERLSPPNGMISNDNDPERISTTYPPFSSLHVAADGTLWVRRTLGAGLEGFDVFDGNGIYLGEVESMVDFTGLAIRGITRDHILAVDTDDLGVRYVVLLRIERPS